MFAHRRRLIASAGACLALASAVLPLVGESSASAAPPATAYSGDAYAVGVFGVKVLNGVVTISDTKINEVGPFDGATPQSGDSGLVTIDRNLGPLTGGIHVGAQVARSIVTEGSSASSASSEVAGANINSGLTGLITADVLKASTSASCSAAPTASFTIVNLKVAGIAVAANVSPNTTVTVRNLNGATVAFVTLNEQTITAGTHSSASASSIVVSFPANGALRGIVQGTVVVSHAESDVTCSPDVPVFVGYADTVRTPPFTPTPWLGSSNVDFVGTGGPWDTGAVRVDNPTAVPETALVTVDIGTHHYDLWGPRTVPANGSLIVSQTTSDNFDTSDLASQVCTTPSPLVPVIHVTINGVTTDHVDTAKVLMNGGIDRGACPLNTNEGSSWTPIG